MARRKKFCLIFSSDPPAIDVVREDFVIGNVAELLENLGREPDNCHCTFRWEKSKDTFETIPGRVLMIGLKKDCSQKHVNAEGNFVESKDLGTRKQEIEKKRMEQVNAQEIHLQEIAGQLLDGGPDAVCRQLLPVLKQKRPCVPKKRDPAVLMNLRRKLAEMSCFIPGENKSRLYANKPVFCDSGKLNIARLKYKKRPKALHRAILKLVIPEKILRLDGISVAGKRGCVEINPIINETIALHVKGVYKAAGGNLNDIEYDPDEMLANLLDNTRRTLGVCRVLDDNAASSSAPTSASTPASITFISSPSSNHAPPSTIFTSPVASTSSTPSIEPILVTNPSLTSTPSLSPAHNSNQFTPLEPILAAASPLLSTQNSPTLSEHSYFSVTDISFNRPPCYEVEIPPNQY